jgi:hypothetical protein
MASLTVPCDMCGISGWNNCEVGHYRCRACRNVAPKPNRSSGRSSVVLGRRGTQLERFEIKVNRSDSECWLWMGSLNQNGYPLFSGGRAHRWSFEWFNGPIPKGMHVDHLCRVRSCVNPEHLEAVTVSENNRRSWETRRGATQAA